MPTSFYSDFDTCAIPGASGPSRQSGEHRSAFQLDRDRVVFSFAFRRLQSKTQVFHPGEYDFYRTRLTHSLEVARIARSVNDWLCSRSDNPLPQGQAIDDDLLEGVGLSHDLGHPPFGHIGERKLNDLMTPYGGFEGNAQTLRILTELIYERRSGTRGMLPTRAFLDGVMKYKTLWSERCCGAIGAAAKAATGSDANRTDNGANPFGAGASPAGTNTNPAENAPPAIPSRTDSPHPADAAGSMLRPPANPPANKFLYDDQEKYRDFVFGEAGSLPAGVTTWSALNQCKSIECEIMDWADDTAYSLHDIADGVKAGFLSHESVSRWAENKKDGIDGDEQRWIEKLLDAIREEKLEAVVSLRIGDFIRACSLRPQEGRADLAALTNRHAWHLHIDPEVRAECDLYKSLATDIIFRSSLIQQLEFKGGYLLERLFNALAEQYLTDRKPRTPRLKLVPEIVHGWIMQAKDTTERARLLCDYLASLTDHQANRLYKRLFDPDFGSINDLA